MTILQSRCQIIAVISVLAFSGLLSTAETDGPSHPSEAAKLLDGLLVDFVRPEENFVDYKKAVRLLETKIKSTSGLGRDERRGAEVLLRLFELDPRIDCEGFAALRMSRVFKLVGAKAGSPVAPGTERIRHVLDLAANSLARACAEPMAAKFELTDLSGVEKRMQPAFRDALELAGNFDDLVMEEKSRDRTSFRLSVMKGNLKQRLIQLAVEKIKSSNEKINSTTAIDSYLEKHLYSPCRVLAVTMLDQLYPIKVLLLGFPADLVPANFLAVLKADAICNVLVFLNLTKSVAATLGQQHP